MTVFRDLAFLAAGPQVNAVVRPLMETPLLLKAANGRNLLEFEAYDSPQWFLAVDWLTAQGFTRRALLTESQQVIGCDEGIMPSFVREGVSLAAGWDNWSGNYLLAECELGDGLLLELARHVAAVDRRKWGGG